MWQNLKRKLLVVSKLPWYIWQILAWVLESLKHLYFNGLLLIEVYNAWAKKSAEELCLMTLKIDAKFEGKLTCSFKNDMTNLVNFCSRAEAISFQKVKGRNYIKLNIQNKQIDQMQCENSILSWKLISDTINKTFYTCSTESLFLRYKKIS